MDYKKIKTEGTTVTREMSLFEKRNKNIYETVCILSQRANQISKDIKEELKGKLEEFSTTTDNLDEIFENREQIEIAKYYEHLPKPSLIAIHEFLNDQVYFRNPVTENKKY